MVHVRLKHVRNVLQICSIPPDDITDKLITNNLSYNSYEAGEEGRKKKEKDYLSCFKGEDRYKQYR
jgi:hypothetical protein